MPRDFIVGEMQDNSKVKPEDIPLSTDVNYDALVKDDEDLLEVVIEIEPGKSKRGWNYELSSLEDIVNYNKTNTLHGFLGHQKPENIASEFAPPVTFWIGSKIQDGKAYFRGVVDKAATDLKRWIRAGQIKQTSIFGTPTLQKGINGEINVIGYKPLSIDWTPLNRQGMQNEVVYIGEMLDGTFENLKEELRSKITAFLGNRYVYILCINYNNSTVVVEDEDNNKLLQFDYAILNNEVSISNMLEVEKQINYIPVNNTSGEMEEKGENMELKEIKEEIQKKLDNGEVSKEALSKDMAKILGMPVGEMNGFNEEKLKEEIGITGEMSIVDYVADLKEKAEKGAIVEHEKLIDKVISENVNGEMAQNLVKDMLNIELGALEEDIKGEIGVILEKPSVKAVISDVFKTGTAGTYNVDNGNSSGNIERITQSI